MQILKIEDGKGARALSISEDLIKTRHRFSDCIYWNLFILIPLITACVGIGRQSVFWLIVYLLLSVVVFFVVVLRSFCTHCPHYAERNGSVKCMFYWGLPKYFEAMPGPYSFLEQIFTVGSLLFWVVLPLFWLCFQGGLLAIYVVSLAVLIATLRRYECGRCVHFCCPGNKVPEHMKRCHLQKKPQEERQKATLSNNLV